MPKKAIVWFRNDLRLNDNQALHYAAEQDYQILFLYIQDLKQNIGGAEKWFLHQALKALQNDLKNKFQTKLIIKQGEPLTILNDLIKDYTIDAIFWNRVYEPYAIQRDSIIKQELRLKDIVTKSFNSSLLIEPAKIKNKTGTYFKVFTPFWKTCLQNIENICPIAAEPSSIKAIKPQINSSLELSDLNLEPQKPNWAANWHEMYDISALDAVNISSKFMQNKMHNYKNDRDYPGKDATSMLSAYLHTGLISPRQIYFQTLEHPASEGARVFLSELGWREFSYYLLYHYPKLPTDNFNRKFDDFVWDNDPENLKRWQTGMTGYPLIDAGMRQLWQTGWMHNRVRMVVASFLIKNLLIDWRKGAAWFADCLIDADLAANSASWQWVAGSGADSAPYFRIFNPITQSEKFDASGDYIRKWVPELADIVGKEIHFPNDRRKYPKPIIDLKSSRQRALDIYTLIK